MSRTMTASQIALSPPAPRPLALFSSASPSSSSSKGKAAATAEANCPACGRPTSPSTESTSAALAQAQAKIADLEAQVRLLNQKAAAAVDRWADYEDELTRLRAALNANAAAANSNTPAGGVTASGNSSSRQASPAKTTAPASSSGTAASSFLPSAAATRVSQFLSGRKPVASPPPTSSLPAQPQTPTRSSPLARQTPHPLASPTTSSSSAAQLAAELGLSPSPPGADGTGRGGAPSTEDLLTALSREQSLRRAAEGRLSDTSREVEELSVSLFEQANEMVATERRARAALEERVEVLERRDVEKRARLERLESAMGRIERVRKLLGEGGGSDQK